MAFRRDTGDQTGFKTFDIIPHLGESLTWVKGSTPTPAGLISADFNIRTGLSTFTIPSSTTAKQVCIPLGRSAAKSVYLNKNLIWQAGKPTKGNDFKVTEKLLMLQKCKAGQL